MLRHWWARALFSFSLLDFYLNYMSLANIRLLVMTRFLLYTRYTLLSRDHKDSNHRTRQKELFPHDDLIYSMLYLSLS